MQKKFRAPMEKWILVALLVCSQPGLALDQVELAALLEEARAEMEMPGLRAAVRLADGTIFSAAVGLADVENSVALDDSVGMPGGSTGKTFVAALTMLLVEDGVLALDDPASKWLGGIEWFDELPNAESMRVRHLLSHSSGMGDYPYTMRYGMLSIWRAISRGGIRFEVEELIDMVDREPLFSAGEGYAYTDAGYLVLGRVLEAASGREYFDLLNERILAPLGLGEIRPQDRSILPDITPGYMAGARNLRDDGSMKIDPSSEWTGGGLVTNPIMLVRFHGALAEGRVVRSESLETMLDSGWRDPSMPNRHYGFGLFVYEDGGRFGHGGLWPGYRTQVMHYSSSGATIAVQTNRDGSLDLEALVARIESQL
ncbi:MAG: beta-lactamase family protein [Gammaproteobacteria bacterium]|nr:beta-lactamase family protein [Gammaproteobacteria bacterium]